MRVIASATKVTEISPDEASDEELQNILLKRRMQKLVEKNTYDNSALFRLAKSVSTQRGTFSEVAKDHILAVIQTLMELKK